MRSVAMAAGLALGLVLSVGPARADDGDEGEMAPGATLSLIAESASYAPGRSLQVAARFAIRGGWHLYWLNPGEAGAAPSLELELPEGVTAGPWRWPLPERLEAAGGIVSYGYEHELILVAELAIPEGFTGPLELSLKADWLACDEELCVPEDGAARLRLAAGEAAPGPEAGRFEAARRSWPVAPEGWEIATRWDAAEGRWAVEVTAPEGRALEGLEIFPYPRETHESSSSPVRSKDGRRALAEVRCHRFGDSWSETDTFLIVVTIKGEAPRVGFVIEAQRGAR